MNFKKNILMGVGNILKGDDGIGSMIAKSFAHQDWLSIDCGVVPENYTSIIKKNRPSLLVIIDAVEMDLDPGNIRIISPEKIADLHITTHSMPLTFLITYLKDYAEKILFIGIQPKMIDFSNLISPEVLSSQQTIIEILKNDLFHQVKIL